MKLLKCMEVEVLQFQYDSFEEFTEHYQTMMDRGFTYQDDNMEGSSMLATYTKKL